MDAQHNPQEAMPTNMEASMAVMTVELRYVRQAVDEIKNHQASSVPRTEWEQRNAYVDSRFSAITAELATRRLPWPTVGAFLTGAIAVALVVIDKITT